MSIKWLLILAVVLSALAGFVYMTATQEPYNANAPEKHSISWNFTDQGYDETVYADQTAVTLTVDGTVYDVGTYNGSCVEIGTNEGMMLAPGELAGVYCWFAGGGDEIGVFSEDGKLVVKHGVLQEPQEGVDGYRGDFRTLFEIPR